MKVLRSSTSSAIILAAAFILYSSIFNYINAELLPPLFPTGENLHMTPNSTSLPPISSHSSSIPTLSHDFKEVKSEGPYDLSLLITSSIRGKLMPYNSRTNLMCTVKEATTDPSLCNGGAAQRKAYIDHAKKLVQTTGKSDGVVVVDAGSSFWGTQYSVADTAKCMNSVKYDVMNVGYADVFEGTTALRELVDQIDTSSVFISTNTDPSRDVNLNTPRKTENLQTQLFPNGAYKYDLYTIHEYATGKFVIFLGLVQDNYQKLPSASDIIPIDEKVSATRMAIAIYQARKELLDQHGVSIAPVIVLSDITVEAAIRVGRSVNGLTAIICGNSESFKFTSIDSYFGTKVLVATMQDNGRMVGELHMKLQNGYVTEFQGEHVFLTPEVSHIEENPSAKELEAWLIVRTRELEAVLDDVVGFATLPQPMTRGSTPYPSWPTIDTIGCREFDCAIGRLVVDAYRTACIPYLKRLCDFGFINSGMLRDGLPKGGITYGNVVSVAPFRNPIILVQISGQKFIDAITHGITCSYDDQNNGCFMQTNALIAFNPSKTVSSTERLAEVRIPANNAEPEQLRYALEQYRATLTASGHHVSALSSDSTSSLSPLISGGFGSSSGPDSDSDSSSLSSFTSAASGNLASTSEPTEIELNELYWVAIPNYLYMGGDNYDTFKTPSNVIIADVETEIIIRHVSKWQEDNPYEPVSEQILAQCLTNELPWVTAAQKDCRTMVTPLTATTALFCSSDFQFCMREETANIAHRFGIPLNQENCSQCSGLGTCYRRKCTCSTSTTSPFDEVSMVRGDRCTEFRQMFESSTSEHVITIVAASVTGIVCVAIIIFLMKFSSHNAVKATSPRLGVLMCISGILAAVGVGLDAIPISAASCTASIWLIVLAFVGIFGILFFRTFRIHQIFNAVSMHAVAKRAYTDMQLLQRVGILALTNIIILSIFAGTSPIFTQAKEISSDHFSAIVLCMAQPLVPAVVISFNGLLLFWGVYLAFKTRHLEENFNESTYIGVAIYNCAFVGVIALPLVYTLRESSPAVALLLRILAICYVVVFTLLVVYIPRVLMVWRNVSGSPSQHSGNYSTHYSGNSNPNRSNGYNSSGLASASGVRLNYFVLCQYSEYLLLQMGNDFPNFDLREFSFLRS